MVAAWAKPPCLQLHRVPTADVTAESATLCVVTATTWWALMCIWINTHSTRKRIYELLPLSQFLTLPTTRNPHTMPLDNPALGIAALARPFPAHTLSDSSPGAVGANGDEWLRQPHTQSRRLPRSYRGTICQIWGPGQALEMPRTR